MADCKKYSKRCFYQIRIITVDKIQNIVSNYYNIPLAEMLYKDVPVLSLGHDKLRCILQKMTTRSLPEIGRRFNNRDHTTVIHAVKTISRLSEQDDEMRKNINQIKKSIA